MAEIFILDREKNKIQTVDKKTFVELGFRERNHLQEWIADNPQCLGEPLLIIEKEFNGFPETNERLDLLALDKDGNIVIIENKLDDSGRDVTWQALKYASYCSTLTKEDIRMVFQAYLDKAHEGKNAMDELESFFEDVDYAEFPLNQSNTQRIFLIAANFRKEVTSTVMWLSSFKVKVKCFKVAPYILDDKILLSVDQIIPTKDAQDYIISMANKVQEENMVEEEAKNRHKIRLKFWAYFLRDIKGKSILFQSSNPTKDHWLVAGGTGISGISYQVVITQTDAYVQVNIGRANQIENKFLFDSFYASRQLIEESFGETLLWERMDDYKSSRIAYKRKGLNYFNSNDWGNISSFLIDYINKLEIAIKPFLPAVKASLYKESIQDEIDNLVN